MKKKRSSLFNPHFIVTKSMIMVNWCTLKHPPFIGFFNESCFYAFHFYRFKCKFDRPNNSLKLLYPSAVAIRGNLLFIIYTFLVCFLPTQEYHSK